MAVLRHSILTKQRISSNTYVHVNMKGWGKWIKYMKYWICLQCWDIYNIYSQYAVTIACIVNMLWLSGEDLLIIMYYSSNSYYNVNILLSENSNTPRISLLIMGHEYCRVKYYHNCASEYWPIYQDSNELRTYISRDVEHVCCASCCGECFII